MSSLLEKLSKTTSDTGSIYLRCCIITNNPPIDKPQINKLNNNYITSKIILRKNNQTSDITEWFSIPRKNINDIFRPNINGDCTLLIDKMNDKEKELILKNTKPIFKISNDMDRDTLNWINRK